MLTLLVGLTYLFRHYLSREYDDLVAREDIELFARTGGWEGKAMPPIRPSSPSYDRRAGLYVTPRGPPYGIDVPAKPLVRPKPRPRAYEAVEISA